MFPSAQKPAPRCPCILLHREQRLVVAVLAVDPGRALLDHAHVHIGAAGIDSPDRPAVAVGVSDHHADLLLEGERRELPLGRVP